MRSIRPDQAAELVRPRDTLAVPLGPGQPGAFLHALSARDDFEDLTVFSALLLDLYPLFARKGVRLESGFFGPAERALRAAGHDVDFVIGDFRRLAGLLETRPPRVMATSVAPAGPDGRFSLSLHAGASVEATRQCGRDPARLLIAEVNADLPRTFGLPPHHLHSLGPDEIDVVIESDRPSPVLDEPPPSEIERAIARHVAAFVPDRATLQTGIGGVPSAVAALLAEGAGSEYGIHSEMFTTGLMRLCQAGKVSNAHKGQFEGVSICTFAYGTRALHDWLHENESVRFIPVHLVNEPSTIAANNRMIAINGALAVDLGGQIVADTIAGNQYSGIGGHEDFVGGASMQRDDRSLVCLPATASVGGRVISRIQATLPRGSIVTTPRHQVDVVVTEYGAAELRDRTHKQRAQALAAIAHPAVREKLLRGEDDVAVD
jgi:acyl-CoA hydrolase